ncbi:MAG: hypothetical protein K2L82_02950 [Lachnospiraceae bacterium]|nr:hypothetical protein [Lachnospiraceae bacterium]
MKKKDVLSVIDSLEKINSVLAKKLDSNVPVTVEVLADCQDAAIAVGNEIEKVGEAGEEAVRLLEAYCENIYQMNCNQSDVNQCRKLTKKIQKQLVQIRNQVKFNLPEEKKQVVFLPYKASMWDSLESVWRAASADKDWESIVMPIPYFTKNKDGTLGEMHYEGADFPDYVPIVDWQQYSLEAEHPAVIFIHNPYDQYNLVTTVHPQFYSAKIRNYTDKLVYIPYFVHRNDMVKEEYCVLPGTLYANVVVLQSEKVREQYIRYYSAALPELAERVGRKAIEEKFRALGSPKFDVGEAETGVVPEEWKEFLVGNRKVLFFNTHLNGLIAGKSEQFLEKIEWVFELFKDRDDVVLLWRPHPLMVETAKSMNPDAVEPYLRLVDKYKEEKIGIYDDTKDLHRAINLSDAYYGDMSSVVELFRHQGKPIMIMDHTITDG